MNSKFWDSRSVVNNLMLMNAVIFLAQYLMPALNQKLIMYFGLHVPGSDYFYIHQVISYMFLHGNFQHMFFNMFALWMFGRILERDLGSQRFLIFYFVTGVGAGLLNIGANLIEVNVMIDQYALSDPIGLKQYINHQVTIGASGGVFGVLLGFGLMHPNDRIMLLIPPIPMKAKYFVIAYGLLELYLGFSQRGASNVAHFAHLGGMLFAWLLLRYWKSKGKIWY